VIMSTTGVEIARERTSHTPVSRGWRRRLPNILTTVRLFLAFVLFWAIGAGRWSTALVVFLVAAATDWLDGYIARLYGSASPLGRMYDPLVDKVLIVGAFVFLLDVRSSPLEGGSGWTPWMVVVLLAREFLVTGIRAYLEERGVAFGADWLGKAKMLLQAGALAWILAAFCLADLGSAPSWTTLVRDILNWLAVGLTAASGMNYLWVARRHLL
jgi:CDP-diacylglycerol---glycerol-3-phosphate 3-phosphatidyltransferase